MGTPTGNECIDLAVESSDEDIQETTLPGVGLSRPKRKGKAEILWYFTEVGAGVYSRAYNDIKGINLNQRTIAEAYRQGGAVKKTLEKTKEIIAQFICLTDSSWAIVDNVGFKIMWKYTAETTVEPPGSKAIKDATRKLYGNMKGKLIQLLADVPRVSLTVDAWTAKNSCGLLGITVHWVNNRWELCERVLAIGELVCKHSGENMSAVVIRALEDFSLKMKVSSITTENASSNGRKVGLLAKELKLISDRFTQDRHVPCAAHVLNIIVHTAPQSLRVSMTTNPPKTVDNSASDSAYELDYDADTDDLDTMQEAAASHAEIVNRDGGLILGDEIAPVRQLVMSIRASTQRRQQYVKTCNDMGKNHNQLPLDCLTWWNSTHDMLHAALEKREVVDLMVLQIMPVTDKDIRISREEWEMLADFRDILGPFYRTTKYVSGSKTVRVVEVIRILKVLMGHIDTILLKFDMATIFTSGRRMTAA
ncbi:putative transcriptional regulator tpeD [Wolffia australiana]